MKDNRRLIEEVLRRLEAGEPLDRVLADYPGDAAELRDHLELSARLAEGAEDVTGLESGRRRLHAALEESSARSGGVYAMTQYVSGALKGLGAASVVAAAIVAAAFFTGNLDVNVGGDDAEAQTQFACLDEVLGDLADPPDGVFTVADLLAARDAFHDQNTDPRYDRDGDGDVDIDDLMVYIQELKDCFTASVPTPPVP